MKKIYKIIIPLSLIVIISIILIKKPEKEVNENNIESKGIKITSQKTTIPYSYYSTYAYQSTSGEYEYKNDIFYYKILKNIEDGMWNLSLYVERYNINKTDFEEYDVIAFVKKSKYSYELIEIYEVGPKTIGIELKENAISESTEELNETLHGGIIFVPKELEIETIEIRIEEIDFSKECKISNRLDSNLDIIKCAYTKEKITEKQIKKYKIREQNGINYLKIDNKEKLSQFIEELNMNKNIEFSYPTIEKDIWENNNILICMKRTKGYFYCEPNIYKDFNLDTVWNTNNLQINAYIQNSENGEEALQCSFILIPKQVNLENIIIKVNQLNLRNFDDNKIMIKEEQARNIAKTYFTEENMFFLRIFDVNKLTFNAYDDKIEEKEGTHFRNVWYINGKKGNIPAFIYVDATTGEIIEVN